MSTPLKALLVEDDKTFASLAGLAIVNAGLNVTHVETGADALDALAHTEFDLIVVDLGLPDIAGVELVRLMRSATNGRSAKIMAVTASNSPDEIAQLFQATANDYYQKTIGTQALSLKFQLLGNELREGKIRACKMMTLEQRIQSLGDEMNTCSMEKDAQINVVKAELTEALTLLRDMAPKLNALVTAWETQKRAFWAFKFVGKTILRFGLWVGYAGKALWPFWAITAGIAGWIWTGAWKWPPH